jgi:PAS domain S-box-containing protein
MFMKPVRDRATAARLNALDVLCGKVMIADTELNIIHANPSVMEMLRSAEVDLKRELPRFSIGTLIGSNIDIFHKDPGHQRGMLARLEKRHAATITVGRHVFDLLVTPLMEAGQRLGYVVEWEDAGSRLKNIEHMARDEAIGRGWAMIEFQVDGTIIDANERFLSLLGYSLDEVKGRHHSMFVDPAEVSGPRYRDFWPSLAAGKVLVDQFHRFGKAGKEVWVEGSYNPIRDQAGKVTKIVKFVTDVTAQLGLLRKLKTSLEQIDDSIMLSTSEARLASTAAGETLGTMQTVAASAEQLAASVQEIAQSMAKSRDATEDVASQAVAVGKSTEAMTAAAHAMGGIVGLIRNVASQINLLALNATIEAARAGDAGKGFAVVASEVKNLAIQAARATEQITTEIDGLQAISNDVASSIDGIRTAVGTVREQVTLTASAIEEQTAVTHGMSSSLQTASAAMSTISASITSIAGLVQGVAESVTETRKAAEILAK